MGALAKSRLALKRHQVLLNAHAPALSARTCLSRLGRLGAAWLGSGVDLTGVDSNIARDLRQERSICAHLDRYISTQAEARRLRSSSEFVCDISSNVFLTCCFGRCFRQLARREHADQGACRQGVRAGRRPGNALGSKADH